MREEAMNGGWTAPQPGKITHGHAMAGIDPKDPARRTGSAVSCSENRISPRRKVPQQTIQA
jgi:hypothetical protein